MKLFKITQVLSYCLALVSLFAEADYHIYLDADRTRHFESAHSIEMGVKTAFDEIDFGIDGYTFKIITTDHRGNTKKSKINMDKMLEDPKFLALYGGLHSPPLIAHRSFINENRILTLVPGAAGAPITRFPSESNCVFRLSVDDSKAGAFLVNYAYNEKKYRKISLLLEKTTWGESNQKAMLKAMTDLGTKPNEIVSFPWGIKNNRARIYLRHIIDNGADCILFVGNAIEGSIFCTEMSKFEENIPIISHWGITGGNFYEKVPHALRKNIDLKFLQTRFSFFNSQLSDFQKSVFQRAARLFPETLFSESDLKAPVGFIHAYDLSKIFIQAMKQAQLSGNPKLDKENIKSALENLHSPVNGLIKTYHRPFSPFIENNPDAHEALSTSDFAMGSYSDNDLIYLEQQK